MGRKFLNENQKSKDGYIQTGSYSETELRFIRYISQLLYFNSINYDKKLKRQNNRQMLVLDQPIAVNEEINTLLDSIPSLNLEEFSLAHQKLEDLIVNPELFQAFILLTDYQKKVLEYSYVEQLSDTDIAKHFKVTQQSISKTRKVALRNLNHILTSQSFL